MPEPEVKHSDASRDEIDPNTGQKFTSGVHFNLNDGISITLDGMRLLGRTEADRGAARNITVDAPLTFEDQHLGIDLTDMQAAIDADIADLDTRVDALETAVTSLETAVTTLQGSSATTGSLAAETSAREAADTALDARLDIFEGTRPPVVLTATNLAGLGTPTGLPAGRTVLGFARDSNRLYIWDPDGTQWVTPTWS